MAGTVEIPGQEIPAYADFEHYYGARRLLPPPDNSGLRAQAGMSQRQRREYQKRREEQIDAEYQERLELRERFEHELASGHIRLMTRRERLEHIASGHPDRPDVQAAQRLLER